MSESPKEDTTESRPDDGATPESQTPADTDAAEPAGAGESDEGEAPARPGGSDGGDGGDTPEPAHATAPPPRRPGGWLLALALLIALAAGGAAGYLGWRLYQLEQRVAGIPAERAAALEPLLRPDALQPLRARIESLEAEGQDTARELGQRVDRVEQALESVRAMTERHQIGWRLAEIRYLLSIAARRLVIAFDTDGAEAALEAADASVAELQDARLLPLRKAIVEDLGAVRAVQPVDIEGIALRLESLLRQADSLPRAPLRGSRGGDAGADDGWWQQLRERLGNFVVIQRRPVGPAPVEPKTGEGLRPADALTLALQDARRAALARDDADYRQALERAAEVLQGHFDPQAAATVRFGEGLADLRGRTVETELPDLSDTLTLARRLAREIEQARRAATADQPAAEE